MDAATTRNTSKYAFFLIAALMAAPAAQAQLQVNGGSATSVTLGQTTQSVGVQVNSTGSAVTFTTSVSYGNGPGAWFSVSTATTTNTTPTSVGIQLVQANPSLGSYSGSVTLKDTSNASDTATINVTYTPGTGTGGGTVTATPSAVTMNTVPTNGAQTSQQVQLTTTSASTITGTLSFQATSPYISLNVGAPVSFQVTSGFPYTFSVIGAAATPTGTYNATLLVSPSNGSSFTIPITYTSGSGSATSVSPNSFTLNTAGPTSQAVTVTTPTTDTYYNMASNAQWLLGGPSGSCSYTNTYIPVGTGLTICLNTSTVTSYPSGTQGTVTVTGYPDGSTATITVTLLVNGVGSGVTITPSSVSFSNIPVGTTQLQGSTVDLTTSFSNVNFIANPTTTTGTNWLSLSSYGGTLAGGNAANALTIYANPSGLSAGTYYGTVSLSYSGGYSGTAQIQVTLGIGTGTGCNGCGTGGIVAPSALTFDYQLQGGTQNLSSGLLVNASGSWTTTVQYNTSNQNWLNVTQSGTSPQISVSVSPAGLSAGTYSANITVTTTAGTVVVPVSVTVSSSMVTTTYPGDILISTYTSGTQNPVSTIYVYTSDGSAQSVTATPSAGWITLSSTSGTTTGGAAAFGVTLNPSVLPNGLNTGSITFTVANASDTTWIMPVAVIVTGSTSTGGPLTFSPTTLAFNSAVGGTAPNQSLTVSSTTASNFVVSASSTGNWLSVTPTSGSLPATLTVSVNTAGLAQNSYFGSLNFTANGQTQSVQVILSIGSGNNTSGLTATPSSLSFNYQVGGTTPAAQTISVQASNGVSTVFTAAASTTSGGTWLSLNVASGQALTTPYNTLTASVTTTGLSSGTYSGSIVLTTTSGTLTIPVGLTVTGAPAITASPTSLTFNYSAGGTAPATQTINVSGTGTFSATAASNGNWLSVSPSSGTSPGSVTASVNPNGLSAGTYNGTIVVAGSGGASGSTTVNVSLVVTAPLPTITQVSNAASYASEAISPGEIITIFGTALGPSTPVQLTLTANGTVSTNIGNVQVLVNGIACPLIYVSSTQVSAVVPYAIAIFQTAEVYVTFLGQSSNAVQESVATTAPGLFTANSSGTGPGAILNQNLSVNSPSNPAAKGSVVVLYLTGEGQTSPAGVTGSVTEPLTTPPYTPQPLLPVAVLIDGSPAAIQFAGEAPALIAGVLQVNVVIPPGTPTGAQSVQVSIGGRSTQNGVTVSVQ